MSKIIQLENENKEKMYPILYTNVFTFDIEITTDWQNIPSFWGNYTETTIPFGTYIIEIYSNNPATLKMWYEYGSGIMSWHGKQNTNSLEGNEISLHWSGHAPNGNTVYLRTKRTDSTEQNTLRLQIRAQKIVATGTSRFTIRFVKII